MSEVINENVPVTSTLTKQGTIEADATGGPLSFDELEELTINSKNAKAKKEPKESKDESKQEKSKDLTSDTDKGKKPDVKADKKESKPEPKEEGKEGDTDLKALRKTIKAKLADSEFELDEEAAIPVKINGKEEMVQIKDLMGNYSGKVAWDKKFSEVDQTRKSVAAQELKLREMADLVKSVYEEQDPNIKMFRMSQLAGIDPVQFREKFFNENISLLEKYYSMTEDERKADALAYEANVHKMRADTLERSIKEKQDYESLSSKVAQLRASHGVSEPEFVSKYDQLEQMVQNGQLDGKLVTPEYIMESIKVDRLWSSAAEKLESLDLGWNQQEKAQKLSKLVQNAHQLGMNPQDMADMVDELWGVSKARNKIEQKKKENSEFLSGKKDVQQVRTPQSEPLFFDEI